MSNSKSSNPEVRRMDERMELVALAHRRYPDMELPLAVRCLESDRRRAGLGALDESKRRVGGNVSNYKRDVWDRGHVVYHLKRHTPARREYPKVSILDFDPGLTMTEMTITLLEIPETNRHLCVNAEYRDFRDQGGRRKIVAYLREARRQLRHPSAA